MSISNFHYIYGINRYQRESLLRTLGSQFLIQEINLICTIVLEARPKELHTLNQTLSL